MYGGYGDSGYTVDDVRIVLGGRAINCMQVDRQIGAEMKAMVLQFSLLPTTFPTCVIDCIEDLTVDTSAFPAISSNGGYDKALRRLVLLGDAYPQDYQSVLQTLIYTNKIPRLCPEYFVLTASDGVHTTTETISVTKSDNRRRRSTVSNRHLYMFRHLSSKAVDDTPVQPHEETAEKSKEIKHALLVIPTLVVFVIVMIALVTFGVWKRHNMKEDPCNSP